MTRREGLLARLMVASAEIEGITFAMSRFENAERFQLGLAP